MENDVPEKKCSFKEHKEIKAIFYCVECKVYLCNKCENFHSKLFEKHLIFNIENNNGDIFTGNCKEENHQIKLEYFCKTHNQLCCAACIAKIKKNENGKHKDCDVCLIEDIKDEKKSKIKENIKFLEELSNNLQKSLDLLTSFFEKIKASKEEIKTNIQKVFTKVTNELNNREDELLLEVDKEFDEIYFNENIMKESKNLPNKIKLSLEKGNKIEKEYDDNKLSLFINNCINIENNIKELMDVKINFVEENGEEVKALIQNINKFGYLDSNNFREIDNPWTTEILNCKSYLYTLKENNYLAEKTKQTEYMYLIKSKYKFKKDKIYKLIFFPYYIGGDFDIGFADYNQSSKHSWLRDNFNCIGLTNVGLYINGSLINNSNIENGKKYEFIIDISKGTFILNIDGNKVGTFSFNFHDDIYAHAGMRKIGNIIGIKTYEKQIKEIKFTRVNSIK